jgi:hypothetical protein
VVGQSYDVVVAALEAHARVVDDLTAELRKALQTASRTTLTGDAYGETAQRFVGVVDLVASAGWEALQGGVEALEAAATDVRESAVVYERQDVAAHDRFTGVGDELR